MIRMSQSLMRRGILVAGRSIFNRNKTPGLDQLRRFSRFIDHHKDNSLMFKQMRTFCPTLQRTYVHSHFRQTLRNNKYSSGSAGKGSPNTLNDRNKTFFVYLASVALGVLGLSYAAVPLYQVFCQQTGYGGTTQRETNEEVLAKLQPVRDARPISIYFQTYTGSTMPWKFIPEQKEVVVVPGETALAFFEAHNPSDEDIIGVATYNVLPARAGVYFHKIQCFCFDEQRLKAHERVDMPVFFYVDPKILKDPQMKNVKSITLSYTFFKSASDDSDVTKALESTKV